MEGRKLALQGMTVFLYQSKNLTSRPSHLTILATFSSLDGTNTLNDWFHVPRSLAISFLLIFLVATCFPFTQSSLRPPHARRPSLTLVHSYLFLPYNGTSRQLIRTSFWISFLAGYSVDKHVRTPRSRSIFQRHVYF